jgi:hypothetical protein
MQRPANEHALGRLSVSTIAPPAAAASARRGLRPSGPGAPPAEKDDAGPGAEIPPGRATGSAPPRLGPDGYAAARDLERSGATDDDGVLREAATFLEGHGSDPRAFKFRLGRATVLARRGDCKGALSALEGVPNSPAKKAVVAACL